MEALTRQEGPADADLVSAYREGDERAATRLVRRHAAGVGRFLYSAGAPRPDVEDLVQEAFFRAFRRLDSWRGDASFRSWLFTIAANVMRDQHRRGKGRTFLTLEDRDIPDGRDPEAHLAADEAGERLREAIAKLPRLQREVFLMRVQTDADYGDIAAALDTTAGAARVHYHHAVKRLKESVR